MTRLRLRKLLRDVWSTRARSALMVLAIAVSVTAVGAFLTAGSVLGREISRNYLSTRPASATLVVPGGVDQAMLAVARAQPGILDAAARSSVPARIRVGDGPWRAMVLFASPPDDARTVGTQAAAVGAWPPPDDGLFLERTALAFLGIGVGQRVLIAADGINVVAATVTGTVHDGGVAPANQEQTAYGYLTATALARLGGPSRVDRLAIVVGDGNGPTGSPAVIGAAAQRLAATLAATAHPVSHIDIPPPLRHPHQGQMEMVRFVLLAFGATSLLLSSLLVATMLGGALVAQTRQIGAMKAIGARTGQLLSMYLWQAAGFAILATALALPPGLLLGRLLAQQGAALLNLDLASSQPPAWVFAVVVVAGIGMPLLLALVPLARGVRVTVRQAIDADLSPPARRGRGPRLPWLGREQTMAARNMVRRRGRFALNLGLLAVAGALLLTGLNTATGWSALVADGLAHRAYDLEFRLTTPVDTARLESIVRGVEGVKDVQAWGRSQTWVHRPEMVDISRVYPDEAHASFTVLAPPADTTMLRLPLLSGRWLRPDDTDAVVLNNLVPAQQAPGAKVGDSITLTVEGRPSTWHVVGIASDFGTQGAAYLTDHEYAAITAGRGASALRVVTAEHDRASRLSTMDMIGQRLAGAGIGIEQSVAIDDLTAALNGHVAVLIDALIAMAMIVGLVGLLGLAAAMSTGVTERTREFAVLHVIGATGANVRHIVVTEGALTGVVSVLVATLAALPLTWLLGNFIGAEAFRQPLPYQFLPAGLIILALLALLGGVVASAAAARRASRLTVREALTTL